MVRDLPDWSASEEDAEVRPYNALAVKLGQHWSAIGTTGSGKTRFVLGLLEYYRRQFPKVPRYVLNSTDDDMPEIHAPREIRGNHPPDIIHDPTYTQVWIPDTDDLEAYDEWLMKIFYTRKPAIVVIDEVASLGGDSRNPVILPGHSKLLKQGRKKGVTVINGIQEVAKAPASMFRQMHFFVQFRINNDPFEVASARRFLNVTKEEYHQPVSSFGFHLKRTGNFPSREYRSMRELFG